jgi:putative peptidoglycan lipid II flippase
MALAALLVGPLKGAGVALALSLASAVNTALLLLFLRRNPRITLDKTLRSVLTYAAKLILFSCVAAVPVLALSPRVLSPWLLLHFAAHRRIGYGLLLAINALLFAAVGIILLAATRDKQFRAIIRMLKKKKQTP